MAAYQLVPPLCDRSNYFKVLILLIIFKYLTTLPKWRTKWEYVSKNFEPPTQSNSFFLFGARGTGKTTWLESQFTTSKTLWLNLLQPDQEELYTQNPNELSAQLNAMHPKPEWVVIDEIQRSPKLLDLVHYHIEKDKIKFALTGSSARKLKRGSANLLAGRAFVNYVYPLTVEEMNQEIDVTELLTWGSLPKIFQFHDHRDKAAFLRSYAQTYLAEEIIAEQIIRQIVPFRKFLQAAAQCNGKIINYSSFARDIGADHKTVENYFEIMEDTLLGFRLPAFESSFRKRLAQKPKFYFFDCGVVRALSKTLDVPLKSGTSTRNVSRNLRQFSHLFNITNFPLVPPIRGADTAPR